MRDGGGKQKGSAFERRLAKDLSLWVSNGEREDIFWRSAMSGGRSTVGRKKGQNLTAQSGDISSIDPLGHPFINKFYVESKHYKKLRLEQLIFGSGELFNFWETTRKEAKFYKKIPFLVAKQNHLPTIICTNRLGIHMLTAKSLVTLKLPKYGIHIIILDEFLRTASPNRLTSNYNYLIADGAFRSQRWTAQSRGIKFLFSFDEWVEWWESNLGPDWQLKRGCMKGLYVMARNGDKGPYTPYNVRCILKEENDAERSDNGGTPCGESHWISKLTETEVIEIYYDQRPLAEVAKTHNISVMIVSGIRRKKHWKHITKDLPDMPSQRNIPKRKSALTNEQMIEVFNSRENTFTLSKRFGVSWPTIDDIKKGKRWSHITNPKPKRIRSRLD